uniref:Uncharacterized protein n=1 Tax=Anguilla anguilla TaxID=7936 RepID=A0A0E9SB74_ANGAN
MIKCKSIKLQWNVFSERKLRVGADPNGYKSGRHSDIQGYRINNMTLEVLQLCSPAIMRTSSNYTHITILPGFEIVRFLSCHHKQNQ